MTSLPAARTVEPAASPSTGTEAGAWSLAALAMVMVGTSVAISGRLQDAPLFGAQGLRYAAAALLLVALAPLLRRRLTVPRGLDLVWVAVGAGTGLVAFNVFLVVGTAHADAAVLGSAVACVPVALAIAGPLAAGQRVRPRLVAAAVVVSVGAVVVNGAGRADALGVTMALGMLVSEAAFTICGAAVIARVGPWSYSTATCAVAAVGCVAVSAVTEREAWPSLAAPEHVAVMAALAALTVAAFVLWFVGVSRIGAGATGLMAGIAAPAAAIQAVPLGGAWPAAGAWLGMAVIGAGLALASGGRR